ncbi:hypothetical protein BCV53_15690 [Parageobacillus thermoglucosidasius]|uniref:Uncharacterized protein n=1 Tax=Parageobacillus thermoglucosidasius TaxID=1426 RepID=A0AAN0YQ60_PARTM|nr:hypothetical protein AOT13_15655 [Parageobacillus thermoglucosidasius]ANZ31403.1 hypothetical protein BCV53_15690 [Parageobacillus thermoglucosidasius]APM82141.1 hypothetical protein BCV54_15700 [Parageobacillus thermoglucosidasius]KJX68023.1 hypothetical protein WH82_14220 [Parageobacillus thermoglucosidasius]MBY6267137.1 hypothetical protein [Parageobacillus thermoglucosidasius]
MPDRENNKKRRTPPIRRKSARVSKTRQRDCGKVQAKQNFVLYGSPGSKRNVLPTQKPKRRGRMAPGARQKQNAKRQAIYK